MGAITTNTLHTITIKALIRMLGNVLTLMDKAEAHAKKKKIPMDKLLHHKLAPDMYDFTKQIGYVYFLALDVGTNLSGKPMPVFTYSEKSMGELRTSIRRTITFLKKISPADIKNATGKKVPLFWQKEKKIKGEEYIAYLGMPDFYFHVVIVYAILRNFGVEIGNMDYVGKL